MYSTSSRLPVMSSMIATVVLAVAVALPRLG
jgi:hypothetical protein